MSWIVLFDDAFAADFQRFDESVRASILTYANVLKQVGPQLGRPYADTLHGSRHSNMKELRPTVNKTEWRIAFAFDPSRQAILLAAAAKGGRKDRLVYKRLIELADSRFDAYLEAAIPRNWAMPVSLDEMMRELPPDAGAEVERNASALAADFRLRQEQSGFDAKEPRPSERVAVGTRAATGQPCPESGIWKVENTTSATAPIAVATTMPPYDRRAVTWILVQHG